MPQGKLKKALVAEKARKDRVTAKAVSDLRPAGKEPPPDKPPPIPPKAG